MADEKKAPGTMLEAILAVQEQAPKLFKTKTAKVTTKAGKEYSYSYADMQVIVDQVGPMIAAEGLVFQSWPTIVDGSKPGLRYRLSHAPSKEFEEDTMLLILPQPDMQGVGSALTYSRRYAFCSVLNLVADEDDDGQAGKATTPGDLARAKSRMTPQAKVLYAEAQQVGEWVDEDRFNRLMDSTTYTEIGLQRFVDWLKDNAPKEEAPDA